MITVLKHSGTSVEIPPTEHSMMLEDGTKLIYRAWIPQEPTGKAMILFHRGHEHSGRLEDVVRVLQLPDIAIFAWDARGHGRSDGQRGYAPSFGCLAKDADEFVRHISETHGQRLEDMVVLGHSVGAVSVAAWVHDYAPPIRGMVLVTPALRVKLFVPFARAWLRLIQSVVSRRPMFVSSYIKGRMLTHDVEHAHRYNDDPLISRAIAVNVLLGLHDTATRLMAYENRPRGAPLLGRIIDRAYLNSVGWAGIRQRKMNIERLLSHAIQRVRETGAPVRILDVASGQGRYVIDTLALFASGNVTALLRDYEDANVEACRALAARRGLKGIAFERADAFAEASYVSFEPRPNIAVVSGLFELFPDNAPVRRCLGGLAGVIEENGYLIYTGQPWHPQIEMIARVLTNRNGEPWVMRRRTQLELDELVREAGFEKIRTRVDMHGIFTVSIAKRRADGHISPREGGATNSASIHSYRSAIIGSTLVARRAGM